MQTSTNILNELQGISPMVAAIEKRNVFTVPNGYFESLSDAVLMNLQQEGGTLINTINTQPAMDVPQGYFDSLADSILNKIKAQGEELSPLLKSIQQQNVFTVPRGYFESLADNILAKATIQVDASTELSVLSPMLYSVQNENVFTVPQGYFETLSNSILRKVEPYQAKVVSMKKRTTSIVLKYAIAAVFTGVMALGVYKFTNNNSSSVELPGYVAEGKKIKNLDAELANISNDDIIKYLQTNGDNIDAQTVASNLNAEELPTQEDYLTDDKALDKYLDNVDLNDLKN